MKKKKQLFVVTVCHPNVHLYGTSHVFGQFILVCTRMEKKYHPFQFRALEGVFTDGRVLNNRMRSIQ